MSGCAAQPDLQYMNGDCGNQQMDGVLSSYKDEDFTYCRLCNLSFPSRPLYAFHVRGLGHIQQLLAAQAGYLPPWTDVQQLAARPWQSVGSIPASKGQRMNVHNFSQYSSGGHGGNSVTYDSFIQPDVAANGSTTAGIYTAPVATGAPATVTSTSCGTGLSSGSASSVPSVTLAKSTSTFSQSNPRQNFGVSNFAQAGSSRQKSFGTDSAYSVVGDFSISAAAAAAYQQPATSTTAPHSAASNTTVQSATVKPENDAAENISSSQPASGDSVTNWTEADPRNSQEIVYCEICALSCPRGSIKPHLSGKKHKRALQQREQGKPLPHKVQERLAESGNVSGPGVSTNLALKFGAVAAGEPVVGLAYIYEETDGEKEIYGCDLCCCQVSSLDNIFAHVLSLQHRAAYLRRLEPALHTKVEEAEPQFVKHHTARVLCLQVERRAGRGVPMLRDPVTNRMRLKLLTQGAQGPDVLGGQDLEPQTMEDVVITGARRILHLQQLMNEAAAKSSDGARTTKPDEASTEALDKEKTQATEEARAQAVEDLKKLLLDDLSSRKMEPGLASMIVDSRLQLLYEHERRGVPFHVARDRVIQEEERWSLLLEFERQHLSFEDAEQRIDHRFQLAKMYEKQGMGTEAARKKVLDEEVIHDFKIEFQGLGFSREQAQKQAERRLWLLEKLEQQGMAAEEASRLVMELETEQKQSLGVDQGEAAVGAESVVAKHSTEEAQWRQTEETVKQHVNAGCRQMNLAPEQMQDLQAEALECLSRYRRDKVSPEEAERRVLCEDLPFTVELDVNILAGQGSMSLVKNPGPGSSTDEEGTGLAADTELETAITDRIQHFLGKLQTSLSSSMAKEISSSQENQASKNEDERLPCDAIQVESCSQEEKDILTDDDRQRLLEEFDRKSRLEIQSLLAEMLKSEVPPEETKERLEALYLVQKTVRQKLFPANSQPSKGKLESPAGARKVRSTTSRKKDDSTSRDGFKHGKPSEPREESYRYSPQNLKRSVSPRKAHERVSPNSYTRDESGSPPFPRRGKSHIPYKRKERSRSRSPFFVRRSPDSPSCSPSVRRSRNRSWSLSPKVSRRRQSKSPHALSPVPQNKPGGASQASAEDNWKSSVDVFLRATAKKNRRSSSSESGRSCRRGRRGSVSRSRRSNHRRSPVSGIRNRNRSLSSISSTSDLGNRDGRASWRWTSPSRGSSSPGIRSRLHGNRRDHPGSSPVTDRSRSVSPYYSFSPGRRARLRSRSDSRNRSRSDRSRDTRDRSKRDSVRSGRSSGSRERPGFRRQSSRSSGSRDTPRRRRSDSRSSRDRFRTDAQTAERRSRRRRRASRERSAGRVTSPRGWGDARDGRAARRREDRDRGDFASRIPYRISSPSLSSSSSSFCEDAERIQYPLGCRPLAEEPLGPGPSW